MPPCYWQRQAQSLFGLASNQTYYRVWPMLQIGGISALLQDLQAAMDQDAPF